MEKRPLEDHDNDSEDDPDYVPGRDGPSSDDERNAKKQRTSSPVGPTEERSEENRKHRDALWQAFQASVSSSVTTSTEPKRVVKIEKRFRYAGEEVTEVKEVPEDSEEAKKWPRWREPTSREVVMEDVTVATGSASSTPAGTSSNTLTTKPPANKRPGPRKSKITLAPLPNTQKAKKLTTLDKSGMDWRSYVGTNEETVKDELDANRKGGGYLEKVEFMHRVADRKEEALEASKSTKRRR